MIKFHRPYLSGRELDLVAAACENGHLSGDGAFTHRCQAWLEQQTGTPQALLTHSCTAALEMAALLLEVGPGDEVIMPSYTFVSTANAFVLRGATPVFVDIRPDTLNIDESLIEAAISERTRAICVVHYAGVGCEMDAILALAARHGLAVVEDAAQGVMARYKGRALGSMGDLGTLSFHETKNVVSGEGGALLVNRAAYAARAEIIREKGTNRSQFFRGEVDKYTWTDIGSSYLPSDLIAAFLCAQLEQAALITERRLAIWDDYNRRLCEAERAGRLRRPRIPEHCQHNAHMFHVLLEDGEQRDALLHELRRNGFGAVFHYVPLHSSPAGRHYARSSGSLHRTDDLSGRLLRLPLWVGMEQAVEPIVDCIERFLAGSRCQPSARAL